MRLLSNQSVGFGTIRSRKVILSQCLIHKGPGAIGIRGVWREFDRDSEIRKRMLVIFSSALDETPRVEVLGAYRIRHREADDRLVAGRSDRLPILQSRRIAPALADAGQSSGIQTVKTTVLSNWTFEITPSTPTS